MDGEFQNSGELSAYIAGSLLESKYFENIDCKSKKQLLRKWAKEERKKLDIESLSLKLVDKVRETKEYRLAQNIMIFYPMKYEVNLLSLLNDSSKKFYLPKVEGERLLCCPYFFGESLCASCFNTQEPTSDPVDKDLIDLIIVPALAVDKSNYRLGYGGGFYDRFLANTNSKTIVCLPEKFILDTIYPEKIDVAVDLVIVA